MDFFYYCLFTIGILTGFLWGIFFVIYFYSGKVKKKRKIKKKKKSPKKKELLKSRMIDKEDSWTDYNCDLDNVDRQEYIEKRRKREDNAYQYLKKKD